MTKMMAKRLLTLGLSSVAMMFSVSIYAGGSSRPMGNPFEAGAVVDLDQWAKTQGVSPLNLIVSSNVASKLGPCGCSMNPKGGVDRRNNFTESKKSMFGTTIILDAGNALFASRDLDPSLVAKQRERAAKVAKAHKDLGIEVQNVGLLDLAAGPDFVLGLAKESGLRFLSTNIVRESNSKAPFEVAYVKDVPKLGKVLILGLSALPKEGFQGLKTLDPVEATNAQIDKHKPNVIIILSDLGQSDDMSLMAKISKPIVVVGSRDLNAIDIPLHAGNGVLVQPGIQGQQLGVFRFATRPEFNSWRNLTQDKALSQRWAQLATEYSFVSKQDGSEDKKRSLERIKESFSELSKYAKGDVSKSWPYAYELVDMDERYAQKNKFTKLSLEDQ